MCFCRKKKASLKATTEKQKAKKSLNKKFIMFMEEHHNYDPIKISTV